MAATANTVDQALVAQAEACDRVGSPLYATLLRGLVEDHRQGGLTAELLDGVSERPVHDAVPLRYLATAHRLALTGGAPRLAAQYPSCGGTWQSDDGITAEFLTTVAEQRAEFVAGMRRNVQTNEVGRAPVVASGMALIATRHRLPIDQLEIGSSAGLLSRWDRYGYDTGASQWGDPRSHVQFGPSWWQGEPGTVEIAPEVIRRRASDVSPIDLTTDHGRATMMSFLWPDQLERVARLRAAIAVSQGVPLHIESADAGEWLTRELGSGPTADAVTVVFHTIVWQYLPAATRDDMRAALSAAGDLATSGRPLCWLRMEPATSDHANLRLTSWPGGRDEHLADVGYHGANVRWHAGGPSRCPLPRCASASGRDLPAPQGVDSDTQPDARRHDRRVRRGHPVVEQADLTAAAEVRSVAGEIEPEGLAELPGAIGEVC